MNAPPIISKNIRVNHPLDPLIADEIQQVAELVRAHSDLNPRILFEQIRLSEPGKSLVKNFKPGSVMTREAFVVVLDRDSGKVYEALVRMEPLEITRWNHIPGVQTCILGEECDEMIPVIKQHPDFIAGLERRGINNLDQVSVESFCVSNFASPEEQKMRLLRGHCFFVESPGDNPHVRPIEGLIPVVDLNTMTVLRVEDNGVVPLSPDRGDYLASRLGQLRNPLAGLNITQSDGPDFVVDGHHVTWQNWKFRVGFTPREGLVLHQMSFCDGGEDRPIVNRASVSELVVPYGDTAGDHYMNHSFDLGEGCFGRLVNSLTLGCDCVGEIFYFDVDLADGYGNVEHKPNAICMHEEDYGVLWKHIDRISGHTEVRRSRRLVVSSFFTVGNYDYGLFWYLYLDGTIEFEAKLTGMLYTRTIKDGEKIPYGTLVAPNLTGMVHEHYFNIRLDMSVDGEANTVVEVEADRIPVGEQNLHGNAHGVTETVIESEGVSGRDAKPENARYWKIVNRAKKNNLGWYPGYKLMPGPNIKPMHQPNSPFMRRAGFVEHDLWVTQYDSNRLHAPGDYLNQNEFGPGLPEWAEENKPLVDTDIVLWHTIGVMHMPRPEDYPVMPVEYVGFMLKPLGFFERNPALDLAPPGCHNGGQLY